MSASNTSKQRMTRSREFWSKHWYGTRGSWVSAWADEVERDPLLRNVRLVVDLIFGGGKRFQVSTEAMSFDFSGRDGVATGRISTLPLLKEEPEVGVSYTFGSGSSGARSLSFSIPGKGIDVWSIVLGQQRFLAGWAEVSLICSGMDWADRFVVMRGDMSSGCSFGTEKESIVFTVSDPKLSTDLAVTEFLLDSDRFSPAPPDSFLGQRYPLIINDPARVPCLRTEDATPPDYLVCFGHGKTITTVYVDGQSYAYNSIVYPWEIVELFDDKGTPYTAVSFLAGAGAWEDSTAVHATIDRETETLNVVESMRYLAEEWSLLGQIGISREAFGRAAVRCVSSAPPAIVINGSSGSTATRALEYIESTICGSFPMISMAWQPSGYGPVITDRRTAPVATWWVKSGDLFKRLSDWSETSKDALFNRFQVRHTFNPLTDAYAGNNLRNPENSLLCAISEEQAGPRDGGPLESTIIEDDEGGIWVVDWQAAHMTTPSYLVEYLGPPTIFFKHRLGDNIDLIEEEITGCDRDNPIRASIEGITYTRGRSVVLLRCWILYQNLCVARN